VHYLVHPDGTLVALGGNGSVGLGLWEPTGERSLVSMLVYPDADPSPDVRLGTAIHLAEWIVDAAGESATVTYVATFERADGTPVPEQAGAFTLQRLHSPTQPGDAGIAAPPEPAWRTELGLPLHGVGRGGIRVVAGEPWDYDVTHADGTLLTLSPPCDRVGLWSPTGERASVRTDWALTAGSASEPQEVGWMLPGPGMAMAIEPLDRERAIAAPDPSSWPSLGTIWVEATADGLAVRSAYFADGTVISVHPVYGTGVGLWQPAGDDTFASTIHYRKGRTRLSGESTVSPDGETISTRYRLVDDRAGAPPEEGVSKATRMHLEVSADPVSPAP
jgi:hypothetical protein